MCTCAHPFFLFVYGVDFSFTSLANENCLTFVFIFSFYFIPLQCNLISTYFLWNFSIKYYNSFLSPKNKKKGILPQSKSIERKKLAKSVKRRSSLFLGLMIIGISYNYGTLTQIDLQKVSYYYRRAIKENNNYYACVNLGALYVSANYFHTAAYFFNKTKEFYASDSETRDQVNYFGGKKYLDNAQKAEAMLQLPIQERIRRSVVQNHSPELHPIFVNQINPPKPMVSESKQPNVAWQPDDPSEILQADIEEHNSSVLLVAQKPEVKFPFDDFVFPVLIIKMKNTKYLGLQREIIFLERNVHYELNQYIQQNLGKIRSQFRKYGFYFVYMPAHTKSQQDEVDLIYPLADTFREDSDFRLGWANGLTWNERRERDESIMELYF